MTEQQPEQVISTPVGADNLDQELTQAKRGLGKVTIGLGVGVLVLVAFFGGVWVHSATAGTTAAPAAAGARPGGTGGGFGGGANRPSGGAVPPGGTGGGAGRGGAVGTISRVEGTTVYVKLQDGTEVKVSTTDQTKVDVTQPGKLADLTPGSSVIVQGARAEDNSVQAQTITKRPTGQ